MINITFFGHSCFLIDVNGTKILFDPFIRPNELAKDVDFDSIAADFICVSHGHSDHVADLVDLAKSTGAKVVCNYEISVWLANQGVTNAHPLNHGGKMDFDFGRIKMVNAVHSSSFDDGTYAGNPAGFVISTSDICFYYAGDTALTYDMKLIGDAENLDFAFLPLGDNFTMGVEDAVRAAEFVGCKRVIGMHFDTFGMIKIDHADARNKFKEAGVDLTLMNINETIEFIK